MFHLLFVHGFVNHAGDFGVASEGEPTETIGCVAPFGFEFQRREPRVKEEAELFHAHFEEFGEEEVSSFVKDDEDGETKDELQGSYEKDFHDFC